MKQTGQQLAERLSYLLEPVSILEADEKLCIVQMRSGPPHRRESAVQYYEIDIRPERIKLCRYGKMKRRPREIITTNVTREVLQRLIGDFAATVA